MLCTCEAESLWRDGGLPAQLRVAKQTRRKPLAITVPVALVKVTTADMAELHCCL